MSRTNTPTVTPDDVSLRDFEIQEIIDWLIEQTLTPAQVTKLRTLGNKTRKEPLDTNNLLHTMKVEYLLEKIENIPVDDIRDFCSKYK
jgi:hypothetical protein